LRGNQEKTREMETIVADNSDKEDKFENQVKALQEEFKLSDTRAEFSERSVDKLESTIDDLINTLYNEKLNYRGISEKLDKTLNDMMGLQ
jgi:antitoxin component YwqK of YwqJK toxin-antitoxin module